MLNTRIELNTQRDLPECSWGSLEGGRGDRPPRRMLATRRQNNVIGRTMALCDLEHPSEDIKRVPPPLSFVWYRQVAEY
jgi:hypothetical protein